jgi:hypothetical protein
LISTNNDILKINQHDRKYFVPDVTNEKVGDTAYFDKLWKSISNEETMKCFYWECIEYSKLNESFSEAGELKYIISSTKSMQISQNLSQAYKFLKEEYVLRRRDIDALSSDLYDELKIYLEKNSQRCPSQYNFNAQMSDIGLRDEKYARKPRNKLKFVVPWEDLNNIFVSKKFIHKDDEYDDEKCSSNEVDTQDGNDIQLLKEK